jgi:hypothetical protein
MVMNVIPYVAGCFFTLLFSLNTVFGQVGETSALIIRNLKSTTIATKLHYPNSVKRFYARNGNQLYWITSEDRATRTFQAMMLLDCVRQYGLSHKDYHPDELVYDRLRLMLKDSLSKSDQVRFDLMLSDAMLSLINHLHYGKQNPVITLAKIDAEDFKGLDAVKVLSNALVQPDLQPVVLAVQPKSKAYIKLQAYMRLVKGQYVGDCYEFPEKEVLKAADKMERLRWSAHQLPVTPAIITIKKD